MITRNKSLNLKRDYVLYKGEDEMTDNSMFSFYHLLAYLVFKHDIFELVELAFRPAIPVAAVRIFRM